MRTTLDIDPAVLSVARSKARAEGISLGRAVSDLALRGLAQSDVPATRTRGFPVLSGSRDHIVTDELVAEHRDD
ncbi:hypothetical protein [Microbacterium gilvum]|uniref:Antitoxin n=1 Tax=Microbacterium gilvum TaxID=1336204 RepID=A0ABP8ZT64_9MICO